MILAVFCNFGKGGLGVNVIDEGKLPALYFDITAADAHNAHRCALFAVLYRYYIHSILVRKVTVNRVEDDIYGLVGYSHNCNVGAVAATGIGKRAVEGHLVGICLGMLVYEYLHRLYRTHSM